MKCARGIGLLVIMVAGMSLVSAVEFATPVPTVGRTVRGTGILQPAESYTLCSEVSRPVAVLYIVPEGTVVTQDERVVELDGAAWMEEGRAVEVQLTEARMQLQAAEEALPMAGEEADAAAELAEEGLAVAKLAMEAFVSGEYPAQLDEAKDALELAQEQQAFATARLERLEASGEDGNADQIGAAKLAVKEAALRQKMADARLRLLRDVLYTQRKATLELATKERQFALMHARNEGRRAVGAAERAVELAGAQVSRERERQRQLDDQIRACMLYAPIAGTVQYVRQPRGDEDTGEIKPGVVVQNQQPLIKVVDTQRLHLTVSVDVEVAQDVEVGQEVSVAVDAFADQTFAGHVMKTDVVPEPPAGVPQGRLTVIIENPNDQLRIGMSATVEFTM